MEHLHLLIWKKLCILDTEAVYNPITTKLNRWAPRMSLKGCSSSSLAAFRFQSSAFEHKLNNGISATAGFAFWSIFIQVLGARVNSDPVIDVEWKRALFTRIKWNHFKLSIFHALQRHSVQSGKSLKVSKFCLVKECIHKWCGLERDHESNVWNV